MKRDPERMRLAHDALEVEGWEKEEIVARIAYHVSTDTLAKLLDRIEHRYPEAWARAQEIRS